MDLFFAKSYPTGLYSLLPSYVGKKNIAALGVELASVATQTVVMPNKPQGRREEISNFRFFFSIWSFAQIFAFFGTNIREMLFFAR